MDLIALLGVIALLEEPRYSDDAFVNASDTREYLGTNNMLNECLEIIVKWMKNKEFEIT